MLNNKYVIKITDFYDATGKGYDAYSYYYVSNNNDEDETKIVLFDTEFEANNFIADNNINYYHSSAEAVIYSEIILNKKELIDFIGEANDQLVLQRVVTEFCKSINLDIEISYKYAVYTRTYGENGWLINSALYTINNNNIVLFDSFDEARRIANHFDTQDSSADVEVYQRIVKYDDTTIVYDIYER